MTVTQACLGGESVRVSKARLCLAEPVSSFLRLLEHTAFYRSAVERLAAEHLRSVDHMLHVLAI